MTQRHYNPMARTARGTREEQGPDEYVKVDVQVTEIRDKSVYIQINAMSTQPLGRSLLHAASDDRINKYRGALPMEFNLSIKRWWLERYGIIKGDD